MECDSILMSTFPFKSEQGCVSRLSVGFEGMPSGAKDDYLTAIYNLYTDLTQFILPKYSTATAVDEKQDNFWSI